MKTSKTDAAALRKVARKLSDSSFLSVTTDCDGSVGVVSQVGNGAIARSLAKGDIRTLVWQAEQMGLVILTSTEFGFTACRPEQVAAIRAYRYAAQAPIWKG